MKKILESIILVFLAMGMIMPLLVLSVGLPEEPKQTCTLKHSVGPQKAGEGEQMCIDKNNTKQFFTKGTTDITGMCCLIDSIFTITDWVFYIVFFLSILLMIIGGGMYITAAGDPAKTEKGRAILKYSIIGLIFAFLAKIFPTIIMTLIV